MHNNSRRKQVCFFTGWVELSKYSPGLCLKVLLLDSFFWDDCDRLTTIEWDALGKRRESLLAPKYICYTRHRTVITIRNCRRIQEGSLWGHFLFQRARSLSRTKDRWSHLARAEQIFISFLKSSLLNTTIILNSSTGNQQTNIVTSFTMKIKLYALFIVKSSTWLTVNESITNKESRGIQKNKLLH